MSYIGRGIDQIDNISTLDNLSFNGSDATFNLTQNSVAFVPVSADALQIQIDGVIQSGNYTVSGSTVTFDFTPSGSSVCNGIKHFGVGVLTTVSDGAVTTAKLGADSVNGSKIADDSISDEHLDITAITGQTAITSLADTDKFLVSDASDSGNLKYVEKQYLPSGGLVKLGSSSVGNSTVSTITFDSIFSSTYESYRLIGFVNADTGGAQTNFRLRASSSDVGSSSGYTRIERHTYHDPSDSSSSQQSIHGHNSNEWIIAGGGMRSDSDTAPCWFDLTFFPNTSRQFFNGTASYVKNTNSQVHTGYVGGITQSNLSPDGIRIFPSTGNFKYVDISIFGVTQ